MFNPTLHLRMALIALIVSGAFLAGQALAQQNIKGQVLGGGAPIAKSTVTLWEASIRPLARARASAGALRGLTDVLGFASQ